MAGAQRISAALFAAAATGAGAQQADNWMEDVHATVGLRAWHTEWTTWFSSRAIPDQYESAKSNWTFIPVVSVSKGPWFVAGSYQAPKTFTWDFPRGVSFKRHEWDVNAGYFIVPGLAVTLGWKDVSYKTAGYQWTSKGVTVGAAGNAPIQQWVGVYGNMAYSRPKIDDSQYFRDQRGSYMLTEFGFAFPLGGHMDALSGAALTAGYRYQRIGATANGPINPGSTRKLYETTQGPVIGFAWRF